MTRTFRFRIALSWLALIATLVVICMLAWGGPPYNQVAQQIALYCGTAIILLWAGTEAVLFCVAAAAKKTRLRSAIGADSAQAARMSSRKSRFLASNGRKASEAGDVAANAEALPAPAFAGKTVLIVDDDFEITQTLVMRFERLGMTALRTSDALQLLYGVHKVKADLVVLDVNMPTGNGLALCEMLNGDESLAGLPVIVYTGSSSEVTVGRCRELGAHYVLKAPHSWPAIEEIVYRLFCSGQQAPLPPDREPHETTDQAEPVTAMLRSARPGVAQPPAALPSPAMAQRVAAGADDPNQRKPRDRPLVLVIDDDPDISAAIALRLSTYSADVLPAFSGMPGYWKAVDMRPDVILCDMRMPDGEANYIVGRLQSHPLTQDIPVIVITGQDSSGMKRVMLNMGVAAYFTKPFIMKDLITELRRHIDLPLSPSGPLAPDTAIRLATSV